MNDPSAARAALRTLADAHHAHISVWAGTTGGEPWLVHDADAAHPAASTMKLPLVIAVAAATERQQVSWEDRVDVHADFDSAAGAGRTYLTTAEYDNETQVWDRLGGTASVAWLADRALVKSSNLATNLLLELVGVAAVKAVFDQVGATTSAVRKGIEDHPAAEAGLGNTAAASEMAAVLLALVNGEYLTPAGTRRVEDILARSETNDAIPAGLPTGTYVAHKPGWIDHACHDVALVRPEAEDPFILSVFTQAALGDPEIHRLVADVAAVCWDHRGGRAAPTADDTSR